MVIKSGTIKVTSVDDGIRGKDYLIVKNGNITVNSGGDGLKSDNKTDAGFGYIFFKLALKNGLALKNKYRPIKFNISMPLIHIKVSLSLSQYLKIIT